MKNSKIKNICVFDERFLFISAGAMSGGNIHVCVVPRSRKFSV